jgi:hypothetical protein
MKWNEIIGLFFLGFSSLCLAIDYAIICGNQIVGQFSKYLFNMKTMVHIYIYVERERERERERVQSTHHLIALFCFAKFKLWVYDF